MGAQPRAHRRRCSVAGRAVASDGAAHRDAGHRLGRDFDDAARALTSERLVRFTRARRERSARRFFVRRARRTRRERFAARLGRVLGRVRLADRVGMGAAAMSAGAASGVVAPSSSTSRSATSPTTTMAIAAESNTTRPRRPSRGRGTRTRSVPSDSIRFGAGGGRTAGLPDQNTSGGIGGGTAFPIDENGSLTVAASDADERGGGMGGGRHRLARGIATVLCTRHASANPAVCSDDSSIFEIALRGASQIRTRQLRS